MPEDGQTMTDACSIYYWI